MRIVIVLLSCVFLASCITPQTSTPKTARTLGKGNWELDLGSYIPTLNLSVSRGFSENFDLRLAGEHGHSLFVVGLNGTYAFLNQPEGFSISATGGIAIGIPVKEVTTISTFLGPIASYKFGKLETYFVTKIGWASVNEGREEDSDKVESYFESWAGDNNATYVQSSLGLNFWFNDNHALNVNANHFYRIDINTARADDPHFLIGGLSYIWRF